MNTILGINIDKDLLKNVLSIIKYVISVRQCITLKVLALIE